MVFYKQGRVHTSSVVAWKVGLKYSMCKHTHCKMKKKQWSLLKHLKNAKNFVLFPVLFSRLSCWCLFTHVVHAKVLWSQKTSRKMAPICLCLFLSPVFNLVKLKAGSVSMLPVRLRIDKSNQMFRSWMLSMCSDFLVPRLHWKYKQQKVTWL